MRTRNNLKNMLVQSKRYNDTTRIASMLELMKFTNTIEKRNQHNKYNQDFKHAKEYHIDDTYDDKHRIIETIQDRHDLEIEREKVNCFKCIEFFIIQYR